MGDLKKLNVDLGRRGYEIIIGNNILEKAGKFISKVVKHKHFVIVTDDNIPQEYAQKVELSLGAGSKVNTIRINAGEASKSFSCLETLLDNIFSTAPERNVTLIALGGGVVGDLTGFAASILLRGVNFIQIPTTLLSQVDSSVGGKTGINNKFGKNLVGSFYQPKLVLIDIDTLNSLPERELLAGYAEVVKYGLINDRKFFKWLDENLDKIKAKDEDALKYIIYKSCQAKSKIVAEDEREGGKRALLNLGHTFGHALEQQAGYDGSLVHGEAVAIGMVMAFTMSYKMGLCDKQDVELVKGHLSRAGLPISPLDIKENWDIQLMMKAMAQDKKVSDGKMVFILAKGIGDSFIEKNVDANIVNDTIGLILGVAK
ncbi:MAG: 3-dehydroquinate synthase [Alphaproteobacteria bacterium CG11_big_fil_rev_8_21_14_0_20_39_49]|nr:MAG: 3-dehydroquinate synthase [Alphaproteobacteria bacterium CG11_big_fil_rev_8_21_14_0_20_39_49]